MTFLTRQMFAVAFLDREIAQAGLLAPRFAPGRLQVSLVASGEELGVVRVSTLLTLRLSCTLSRCLADANISRVRDQVCDDSMQRNRNWVYLTKVAHNGAGSAVADSPRASARSAIIAQCILAFLRAPIRDVRRCAIALCASPSQPKRLRVRRGARAALKRASLPDRDRGFAPSSPTIWSHFTSCPATPWPRPSVYRPRCEVYARHTARHVLTAYR